jgi:hypothetical protein
MRPWKVLFSREMTFNSSYHGMYICIVKQKYLIWGVQAQVGHNKFFVFMRQSNMHDMGLDFI